MTPGVAEHVARRDYSWYVQRFQPDYLVFSYPHRPVLEAMVETDWFDATYALATTVATARRAAAIYGRRSPADGGPS